MADGWQDLDIQDMAETADKYNFSLWMGLFCSKLRTQVEMSGEKVAEMIIVGSRYKHSAARELREVARNKIKERREITEDPAFRESLRGEDPNVLFDFLAII